MSPSRAAMGPSRAAMSPSRAAMSPSRAAMSPSRAAMSPKKEEPLSGWRILTTRASRQSGGLAKPLREMGAEVVEIPTIEIKPPRSYKALDSALRKISEYDWLILTSVNGVEALFSRLKKLRIAPAKLAHLEVAAIAP